MRLFIAAELPDEVVDALAETSAALRGCVRGRYVSPDSFHATLAFLGEVEGCRVDDVCAAIDRGCAGFDTFTVSLGDLGCFGKRSKATLWQGFREAGALPALAQSVRDQLRADAFSFDGKTFLPHVTLMRAANLTEGELPMPIIAAGSVSSIALFRSDLSGARPAYEPLYVAQLGEQVMYV